MKSNGEPNRRGGEIEPRREMAGRCSCGHALHLDGPCPKWACGHLVCTPIGDSNGGGGYIDAIGENA